LNDSLVLCCLLTLAQHFLYLTTRMNVRTTHLALHLPSRISRRSCLVYPRTRSTRSTTHHILSLIRPHSGGPELMSCRFPLLLLLLLFCLCHTSSIPHDTAGSERCLVSYPRFDLMEKSSGLDRLFISALWSVYIF
jgi:hypothetical protein